MHELTHAPTRVHAPDGHDAPSTLREWVRDLWLSDMRTQVKPSTLDSYERNYELHLLPRLGDVRLADLTPRMINAAYADLLERGRRDGTGGLSPKTVRNLHIILTKSLHDAVDDGLIATNPADRARPPRARRFGGRELRAWTPEQLATFLRSVAGTRLEAAWHLAAMTGMRRGEVLGLRWTDIDAEHSRLSVRQTIVSVAYDVQVSTPKNHQARVIDLDRSTLDQLAQHWQRQNDERARPENSHQVDGLVFCRPDGQPIQPDLFTQSFERALSKTELPRIRLHDLRHTHATIALMAGVPTKVVCERLGHQSPAFTLQQYAHALPGMQAEAAAQIADVVFRRPSEPTRGLEPLTAESALGHVSA